MKEGGRIARGEKISRSTGRRRRGRGEGRRGGDEKSEKFSTRFLGFRAEVGSKRCARKETRTRRRRRRRRGELFTAVSRPREQKLDLVRFHFRSFAIHRDSSPLLSFASIKMKNRLPPRLSRQIARRLD